MWFAREIVKTQGCRNPESKNKDNYTNYNQDKFALATVISTEVYF